MRADIVTLLWILLIPFIGGLLCWQMERLGGQFVRWVALASMSKPPMKGISKIQSKVTISALI